MTLQIPGFLNLIVKLEVPVVVQIDRVSSDETVTAIFFVVISLLALIATLVPAL